MKNNISIRRSIDVDTTPLVSVVLTSYNAADFIGEAILSILNQTYRNLELIVVDDCSTDGTWDTITALAGRDSRMRIFRLPKNGGPSVASNYGIPKARGKYIARMDADDVSYPTRIGKQVAHLESHPDVIMLGGQCDLINEAGSTTGEKLFPTQHDDIYKALFTMNPIPHPASMFRRNVYRKARISYEKKYFISHDLKILYVLSKFGKYANLEDKVLAYRVRPNSITHRNPKRAFRETVAIRHWAWFSDHYKPTPMNVATHVAQTLVVLVLPNYAINALFLLWREKQILFQVTKLFLPIPTRFYRLAYGVVGAILLDLLFPRPK